MRYSPSVFALSSALLVLLLACSAPAGAQAQKGINTLGDAPEQILPRSTDFVAEDGATMEELTKRMLESNPELQAARQRLVQAEARLIQAGLRPNPHVDFQEKNDRIISDQGRREEELTFNQPLELGGRRGRRMDLARVEIERIRNEVADLERQRIADLGMLVGQALSEAAHLSSLERISGLNESLRAATQIRIKAGDASNYDFAQVEVEGVRLEAGRLRLANLLDRLLIRIRTLTNLPADTVLRLRDQPWESMEEQLSAEEALRIALETRPDLRAAKLGEQEAEARLKVAGANAAPDFGVILGFKRNAIVRPAPVQSSDWQFKVGVSVGLPVFNRNQGMIREGAAAVTEERFHRESLEQMVRRDVIIAFKRLNQAQRDVKLYEDRGLRLQRSNVEMAKLGFEQGDLRLVDYIDEQRRLNDLEDAYAQAKAELFQARVELRRAVGR